MVVHNKKNKIIKIIGLALSISMIILSSIFLSGFPLLVCTIIFFVTLIFGVVSSYFLSEKFEIIYKSYIVALSTMVLAFVIYIILYTSGILATLQSIDAVVEFIRSSGQLGAIVFIIICLLNVIFLPLPTPVTAVIGTVLFGSFFAFVYLAIGTVLGSIITFSIGKIFGKKVVIWMIGKEKTDKYAELIDKKGRGIIIFMMILPFFPDDVICLVSGITNMTYRYFIIAICTIRTALIAFMCFFASGQIIPFSGWGIPVWITLAVIMLLICIVVTIKQHKKSSK